MVARNMYGVVIWSNADQRKAIIWCEDQGDLAYYTKDCASALDGVTLDPGDLIQFDLRLEQSLRMVDNPQRVESGSHSNLASSLSTENVNQVEPSRVRSKRRTDNIVTFPTKARPERELILA